MEITTKWGQSFFVDEIIEKKDGKYYRSGYMLWHESKIINLPKSETKSETKKVKSKNEKPQKIYKKSN